MTRLIAKDIITDLNISPDLQDNKLLLSPCYCNVLKDMWFNAIQHGDMLVMRGHIQNRDIPQSEYSEVFTNIYSPDYQNLLRAYYTGIPKHDMPSIKSASFYKDIEYPFNTFPFHDMMNEVITSVVLNTCIKDRDTQLLLYCTLLLFYTNIISFVNESYHMSNTNTYFDIFHISRTFNISYYSIYSCLFDIVQQSYIIISDIIHELELLLYSIKDNTYDKYLIPFGKIKENNHYNSYYRLICNNRFYLRYIDFNRFFKEPVSILNLYDIERLYNSGIFYIFPTNSLPVKSESRLYISPQALTEKFSNSLFYNFIYCKHRKYSNNPMSFESCLYNSCFRYLIMLKYICNIEKFFLLYLLRVKCKNPNFNSELSEILITQAFPMIFYTLSFANNSHARSVGAKPITPTSYNQCKYSYNQLFNK